jgi:hypothetical protein
MKKRIAIFFHILIFLTLLCSISLSQDSIVISEFMALNNATLQDEDGDFSDWIEIYNPGDTDINLANWYLTDDIDDNAKWSFPSVSIAGKEYLVVFASGKDRRLSKNNLHTNFKLSGTGEFLALIKPGGKIFSTVFTPVYPIQYNDISYGDFAGESKYFTEPSPGNANTNLLFFPPPKFSVEHGYFYSPFLLELLGESTNDDIYYTIDASTPNKTKGVKYTTSIKIDSTVVIRAISIKSDSVSSETKTQTYIFPSDVIHQSQNPAGYPSTWLAPIQGSDNFDVIPSDYGMNPEFINKPEVNNVIIESLKSLPVVSITSDIDNFFSKSTNADSGGIYMYTGAPDGPTIGLKYHLGHDWIRSGSIEYFDPEDGSLDFQSNCGIRIHGGASRTTYKTAKHSFRVGFKAEYGPTKLKEQIFGKGSPKQYDWLVLRGGFAPRLGQQVRDPWSKSTMRDMGQYASRSKFVHLYLNGQYWGMYNLSERMDENCMRDNLGGSAEDYDMISDYNELAAGDTIAWTNLVVKAGENITDNENYQKLQGNNEDGTRNPEYEKLVDVENLTDYVIMNLYAGMTDWDFHNWAGARRKTNSEGFQFLVWDAESAIQNVNENRLFDEGYDFRPTGIFSDLYKNAEFKKLFISRVNKHFFEGGALIPQKCLDRYINWLDIIDTAIISESARWEFDENDIWNKSYHSFIYNYFPVRTEIVFKQFITDKMYPSITPPVFNTTKKTIPEDFQLFMTSQMGGEIRYTLDGTDPGYYSPNDQSSVITYDWNKIPLISDTLKILARVKKDSLWSKLITKQFTIVKNVSSTPETLSDEENYFYNYPNPVIENTTINYTLKEHANISLRIYNVLGEYITTLDEGEKPTGLQVVTWIPGDLPSGMYFCILENKTKSSISRIKILIE